MLGYPKAIIKPPTVAKATTTSSKTDDAKAREAAAAAKKAKAVTVETDGTAPARASLIDVFEWYVTCNVESGYINDRPSHDLHHFHVLDPRGHGNASPFGVSSCDSRQYRRNYSENSERARRTHRFAGRQPASLYVACAPRQRSRQRVVSPCESSATYY